MARLIVLQFILLWHIRDCISCPSGYTWCIEEKRGNCNQSGVIAYGADITYTYQTSSGSILCDNIMFGDPVYHTTKECCSQTQTLTGPLSPIVGTISCDETVYSFFGNPTDIHYWQLTTTNFNDITYSLCNSAFNTRITVHNSEGTEISLYNYCPNDGNDCGVCPSSNNNEHFTITSQLPETYYIKIMSFNNTSQSNQGEYNLNISCAPKEYNFASAGCFRDNETRAMSVFLGKNVRHTIEQCKDTCLKYKYFAVEYGLECFCDDNYSSATQYGPSTKCKHCTKTSVNCPMPGVGGSWALNLYYNQYDLILDHKNVTLGYFSTNLSTTGVGLENENDPTANTYCIIGNINGALRTQYQGMDGKYTFKLIYKYNDSTQDVVNWRQSSWITDAVITGADLFDVPYEPLCPIGSSCDFQGLALSTDTSTYLDGDGNDHIHWYHSVGSNVAWNHAYGIPAVNKKTAVSQSLFILNPIIPKFPTVSPTTDPTAYPTYDHPTDVPTNNPTYTPTANPTANPTTAPSNTPTSLPSNVPSYNPSISPTFAPSITPSDTPSQPPTHAPTSKMIVVGNHPDPTHAPTRVLTAETVLIETVLIETTANSNDANRRLFGMVDSLLMVILLVTIAILLCCVIVSVIVLKRRKKRKKTTVVSVDINATTDVNKVEMGRVNSVSTNSPTITPNGVATICTSNGIDGLCGVTMGALLPVPVATSNTNRNLQNEQYYDEEDADEDDDIYGSGNNDCQDDENNDQIYETAGEGNQTVGK